MALPHSGPVTTLQTGSLSTPSLYKQRYKQAPPFRDVLPYVTCRQETMAIRGRNVSNVQSESYRVNPGGPSVSRNPPDLYAFCPQFADRIPQFDKLRAQNIERAGARLRSRLGSSDASLGVFAAEFGETYQMCQLRLIQLTRLVKGLSARNPSVVFDALKDLVHGAKRPKNIRKNFSDAFLEYQFGWAPAVNDIHAAMEALSKDIPSALVTASSSSRDIIDRVQYSDSNSTDTISHFYETHAKVGCYVKVSNPNLYLANRLGIVNPLTIGFDIIPFSFIAGWFVNVHEFLNQYSAYAGLSIERSFTSVSDHAFCEHTRVLKYPNVWHASAGHDWTVASRSRSFQRDTGLPVVHLRVSGFLPDFGRLSSITALLVQRFG